MSSLRDFDRVEDRIRQHRQVEKRPVLIVEGSDDLLVLKSHVPAELIFPADGKPNVLRALNALREWRIAGVRAVVDADFDDSPNVEGVLTYEGRDLEAMLIGLGALALVLEHQGSSTKLTAAGGAVAVVDALCTEATPVARLRYASMRNGWGLRFDAVELPSKADKRTVVLNLDRYASALVQASDTETSIVEARKAMEEEQMDDRGARGKDVVALAGLALRHKVGSLPQAACEEPQLSGQLRIAGALPLERSPWLTNLRGALDAAEMELKRGAA